MRLFSKLRKKLTYLEKKQIEQIYQAYQVAKNAHSGQKRSSGESYISHPLAVSTILADMHMDPESIKAALLHDVIEDTSIEKDVIEQQFGKIVASLVDGVTKLTKMQFSTTAEAQAESFRKMILAMSLDIRVILVKLADRLHNMRTLTALPPHKRRRIARETLEIYAPIANRLGIHDLYIELENLAFAALYPMRNRIIEESIKKARGNRKNIMHTIEKEVKKHFARSLLSDCEIIGREKHLFSIYRKMQKKQLPFSQIMDVYAFRIVVNNNDDCYRALGIAHSLYKPVPGKFKDYIAIPKINGYQSLHTCLFGPHGVPIEIQIRTRLMEQVATKGIAAHWLYKSDERIDQSHIRAQQWVNDLLEMQQKTGSSLEFIENVKIDLFPDVIYVFTPKGGIMELPRGSTPIDFAYAVHTDIGNSAVAARIDRQFAPLSTILLNGQTVSIITAPKTRPNPLWLSFVKTGKARSGIRHFLKNQQRTESISLGSQLLTNALNDLSLTINKIPKAAINTVLQKINLKTIEDLHEEIGLGNKIAVLAAHQLANACKHKRNLKQASRETTQPLLIKGTEGIAVHAAPCCHPIPGDAIVGYLTPGNGLTIHRETCEQVHKLRMQPEQFLLVRWADDVKGEFSVLIDVEMSSRRGSFAILTKSLSDAEANIEDITIKKRTGEHYVVALKVLVHNTEHLKRVIRHVTNLAIVTAAARA